MIRALVAFVAMLIAGMAQAAEPWRMASSEHFVIYARLPVDKLRLQADQLERFDQVLRMGRSIPDGPSSPAMRVTVFVLPNAAAVESATGQSNVAGVYRASARGAMAITSNYPFNANAANAQVVLLHEYAHHFMLSNFPAGYPRWFVEGFAEYASGARFAPNGDITTGVPAYHRSYGLFADRTSFGQLVSGKRARSGEEEEELYAKGWLLTHYFSFEQARAGQLETYLRLVNEGKSQADAATEAFGDLTQFSRDLNAYRSRGRLSARVIKADRLKTPRIEISELSAGAAAIMMVRMNSTYGVNDREAAKLAVEARRIAALYPDDPAVLCALAEAEEDAHDLDRAAAAADRLLALDAQSFCGMMFKGRVVLAAAQKAEAPPGDQRWADARAWFIRANRVEQEHPWPMAMFYYTVRDGKIEASRESGYKALLGAQDRAPQDSALRLAAGIHLLREGDTDGGRRMLAPLAANAHGSRGAWLVDVLARIGTDDSGKIADDLEKGPPQPASASPA